MTNQIEGLAGKIKTLESQLILELQKKEKEFFYVVVRKKVRFEQVMIMKRPCLSKSQRLRKTHHC